MALDDDIRELASGPNYAALTTLFADGRAQTQVVWVDADEDALRVNTEVHRAKAKNLARDPRATVTVIDAANPYHYIEVRGRVVSTVTGPEARAHIDELARKYTGGDYANPITSERVMLRIVPDEVNRVGR
jgi:PPOX class probable F420-dependent enzyme